MCRVAFGGVVNLSFSQAYRHRSSVCKAPSVGEQSVRTKGPEERAGLAGTGFFAGKRSSRDTTMGSTSIKPFQLTPTGR